MARQVLPLVGAAVGFYFGGPLGAQLGFTIGSVAGNIVDPEIIKGPGIGDLAQQTSQEGVARPIVFALSPPMAGNIIASGEPRIVKKRQRAGKGGPKVESESVFRTYAIGVCEGPITSFVRVWRNGILVYDVSDNSLLPSAENEKFLETARFFLGGWDQEPSPDLEALFGVGTTPTHRGQAYMVMADEDLTDLRGAIPQYVFQVERCEGFFLTSRPYPIEAIDTMLSIGLMPRARFEPVVDEAIDSIGLLIAGSLEEPMIDYDDGEPEAIDSDGMLLAGELRDPLVQYSYNPDGDGTDGNGGSESLDSSGELLSGTLVVQLIQYQNYPPEAIDSSGELIAGTLT